MYHARSVAAALVSLALTAGAANAVSVSGFFAAPLSIGNDAGASGTATAAVREDFGTTSGSVTFTDDALAGFTVTVNPFLNASAGDGLSNSIMISYMLDAGPSIDIPITQTNNTGSALVQNLSVGANSVISFAIMGVAGREGNTVDVKLFTDPAQVAPVPLAPAGALGLTGLVALAALRRRRRRD